MFVISSLLLYSAKSNISADNDIILYSKIECSSVEIDIGVKRLARITVTKMRVVIKLTVSHGPIFGFKKN
jgi:hypothetical protein